MIRRLIHALFPRYRLPAHVTQFRFRPEVLQANPLLTTFRPKRWWR